MAVAEGEERDELLGFKAVCVEDKKNAEAEIAALRTETKAKWSKENHPAFRKQASATPTATPTDDRKKTFAINDMVSAKYSADKKFYPAQIISITGSASAPIYTVKFKGYEGLETVRAHEILALPTAAAGQKRKAEDSPVVTTPLAPVAKIPAMAGPNVISAAANIDPALAEAAKKAANKTSEPPRSDKPVKIRGTKVLETNKQNWQEFSKGGKGKGPKKPKESMFRTGDAPTARGTIGLS